MAIFTMTRTATIVEHYEIEADCEATALEAIGHVGPIRTDDLGGDVSIESIKEWEHTPDVEPDDYSSQWDV